MGRCGQPLWHHNAYAMLTMVAFLLKFVSLNSQSVAVVAVAFLVDVH